MPKFTTDSKFLSHADLSDIEDTIVTIKSVERETVGQGAQAQEKWILYFKELKKGLGLNKTNGKLLCQILHSDEMEDWIGHKIALWVKDDVEFQGEIVSAIRVRPKLPGKAVVEADANGQNTESSPSLTIADICTRMEGVQSKEDITTLSKLAMSMNLSAEDIDGFMVLKTQRLAELQPRKK